MSLDVFEFLGFGRFFQFFRKNGFLGILGPPYCGIGATIRIGRLMLCLPYAGFFLRDSKFQRPSKLHYWFKSYGDFAQWMDFAYW